MDLTNKGVTKGHALKKIQSILGIKKEETLAFGDNINDLEMLAEAKYSFAIGNAREEVKMAAAYVAESNKNEGVLKVLEELLGKERIIEEKFDKYRKL